MGAESDKRQEIAMFELIISACLISSPKDCNEFHLTYLGNITPMQCMIIGQPEMAKWEGGLFIFRLPLNEVNAVEPDWWGVFAADTFITDKNNR